MRIIINFCLLLLIQWSAAAQETPTISVQDWKAFAGNWSGILTYKNYRDGRWVDIKATLEIKILSDDQLILITGYPDEPNHGSTDTLRIGNNGRQWGQEKVRSVYRGSDSLLMKTEKEGWDDNRKAGFVYTYAISSTGFSIKKEVRFAGSADSFVRHEYRFGKVK